MVTPTKQTTGHTLNKLKNQNEFVGKNTKFNAQIPNAERLPLAFSSSSN
jgi:hypothetical protein